MQKQQTRAFSEIMVWEQNHVNVKAPKHAILYQNHINAIQTMIYRNTTKNQTHTNLL